MAARSPEFRLAAELHCHAFRHRGADDCVRPFVELRGIRPGHRAALRAFATRLSCSRFRDASSPFCCRGRPSSDRRFRGCIRERTVESHNGVFQERAGGRLLWRRKSPIAAGSQEPPAPGSHS